MMPDICEERSTVSVFSPEMTAIADEIWYP